MWNMWLKEVELYPRFLRSVLWMIALQNFFISSCMLLFKIVSCNPVYGLTEWMFYIFHWKTITHQFILSCLIIAFGALNVRFCAVEKHVSSTRFERICRALSPYCLQHVFAMMSLGGAAVYSCICLFHNFGGGGSFLDTFLLLTNGFEQSFVIGHGCFTGMMFSLKYFICNMYLLKFNLDQESKVFHIKSQVYDLLKESFFCILKAVHWYYLGFIIFGSPLKILTISYLSNHHNENESIIYSLINPRLFIITISTGIMISFIWSLYLVIFNAFATEHHVFPVKVPIKENNTRTLSSALTCKDSSYLKCLALLDLRLLSQFDLTRRKQIFAISHPGGHPHEWKAIANICITSLQDFMYKLYEYSFAVAAATNDSKNISTKISKVTLEKVKTNVVFQKPVPSFSHKIFHYFREKPAISYFLDELPNANLMKLFASSQPFIWMIDALGYLVALSYNEDQYGVVQQSLPDIIRLLLDLKMAEEKMPIGLVGIRPYVRDPQGRYEHIHQRLSLKTTINNALCRIANTFEEHINGISLPEEYQKYFQRYLTQKN